MKFRISQWLDTSDDNAEEYPTLYGVQANRGNGWQHCRKDREPLIFKTEEEAHLHVRALRGMFALSEQGGAS